MSSIEPLVSIICTCYNQESFIAEALRSVINQTYPAIELIVVDDKSSDSSSAVIKKLLHEYPDILFISNSKRIGLCQNFNRGLSISSGKYIVDLSGDDVLIPDRIDRQVNFFERLSNDYGVIYSNAEFVDLNSRALGFFYPIESTNKVKKRPPEGDIYLHLIETCPIATQTMLMRRATLEQLGGYDENLAYEDFDFWIRSSRNWKYAYQDEILTKIRKTSGSLSTKQYDQGDQQLLSTFEVCKKIKTLNKTEQEKTALVRRLKYEIKHATLAEKRPEAKLFIELLQEIRPLSVSDKFFNELSRSGVKTAWLRDTYLKLKN